MKFDIELKRGFATIGVGQFTLAPEKLPEHEKHLVGRSLRPPAELDRELVSQWVLKMENAINATDGLRVHISLAKG